MTATNGSSRRSSVRKALIGVLAAGTLVSACSGGGGSDGSPAAETDAPSDPASDTGVDDSTPASGADGGTTDTDVDSTGGDSTGGDSTVVDDTEGMEPITGGTLRYALEAEVDGLNPTSSSLSAAGLQMGYGVFDTLASFDTDGNWQPWLAESFTSNDDFTVWTMKLRPDVTFHDGAPLNADAVVANFDAQYGDPTVGLAVKPFFPETGGAIKVDDLTVEYHPLDPDSNFPAILANQLGMVASPAWLDAAAADATLNQQPVGSGPFKFDSRTEDSLTRFVRNDDWWGGDVYLDAVEFLPVTENGTRVELIRNGEIQALHTTDPDAILNLQDTEDVQNLINISSEEFFVMINAEAPPFDDIRARQALTYATPVADYAEFIGLGVSPEADQMFTPESKWYNPDVVQEGDDPDKAAPLVEAYCAEHGTEENPVLKQPTCTDGKINIEFQWAGPSDVQTQIADLLDDGWSPFFNVTRDELQQDKHIQQTAIGSYNVGTWRQFGAADPSSDRLWLMCRTVGDISLNWPRYCDAERDQLLLDAQATDDEATRIEKFQQISQNMHDAYTYIFLAHTSWDNAWLDTVHGVCDRTIPGTDTKTLCTQNGSVWLSSVWMES